MQAKPDPIAQDISALRVSPAIQQGVREFVSQVVDLYAGDLVSVSAFGSAVTGDYDSEESDINLLIVYSDLEIVELARVANLSRHWLRKHKFAPRFLSKRNVDDSAAYFQIDFLSMRDAHLVICGEDVLAGIQMRPEQLRWQIAYEVKAMRMRLKQQYWRTVDDPQRMRVVLTDRFTSLVHLMRALLLLRSLPAPVMRRETLDAAAEHFGIDRECAARLLDLRRGKTPGREALGGLFAGLMEMIRIIDSGVEERTV
jgi:predicted nucleotidyltransferase